MARTQNFHCWGLKFNLWSGDYYPKNPVAKKKKKKERKVFYLSMFMKTVWRRKEKAMATHSSTLAWKIPRTEEPGGLQSMGSLRVGHN